MKRKYFKYCPRCAGQLRWKKPRVEAAFQQCSECGYALFDNPIGAVEVIIIRDGKVLMFRRIKNPGRGCWDFPGGFLDGFETPEHGAIREANEETGLTFKPERLFGIYINRDYMWKGRKVPCIVPAYIGSATGRIVRSEEMQTYAWQDVRRIRNFAFRYQQRLCNDLIRQKIV